MKTNSKTSPHLIESKLRKSELRYRCLFESARDGILIVDAVTGMIEDVNPYLVNMLGYTREEFIKKKLWEVGAFKDIDASQQAFKALQKTEYIRYDNLPLKTKGGKLIQVEFVSNLYKVGDEDVIQCNIRDITERKEAEEALIIANRRSALAQRSSGSGVWSWDIVTDKLDWSPELFGLFGLDEAIIPTFDVWRNVMHPDDRQVAGDRIDQAIGERIQLINEYRIIKPTGEVRWIIALGDTKYSEQGEPTRMSGICIDMTENKRKEEEFKSAKSLLDTVIESSPFAMWISDREGMLVRTNSSLRETLNLADEQLIGKYNVLHDVNLEKQGVMPMVRAVFEKNKSARFVIPWKGSDSGDDDFKSVRDLYIDISIFPILDNHKELTNVVCQWVDITDRKLSEEALAESERKLRTLYETMSEGIVYEDHNGTITSANPAAERLLGVSIDQMQGRTSVDPRWKAIHADGSPFPGETHSLNVAAKTGKPAIDEIMGIYNPKSGTYVWLSVNSTPEFLPGEKKPFRAYAVFRDITDRKLAEEMLAKSENQYRLLFDEMLSGFALHEIICDQNGKPIDYRFLSVNTAFENITGLVAQDIIGKTVIEALPGIESSWIERYGKVALTGEPTQFENYAAALGKYYEVRAYCPEHGKFATLINEITERKQAEDTIRRLARFPSENPNPVIRISKNGYLLYANESAHDKLEAWKLVEEKPAPEVLMDHIREVFKTRTTKTVEIPCGDRIYDVSITPAPVDEDTALYFRDITEAKRAEEEIHELNAELEKRVIERTSQLQSSNKLLKSELTERKRAEKALREIKEQFRRLSEAAFEAIIIHDGGILLSTNNQYCDMFGYKPEELLGKQVMPLTIAPDAIDGVKKMIATGNVGPYESIGQKKDGTRFPMEIRVRAMDYERRKVRVAAIMDITERKQAEEELKRQATQLEAANKELEAFSYSVSHDLRAPLRGIDGWSQALLEDYGGKLDEQGKTYLARVRSETKRMSQLIDDLLQLSRLTSTEMVLEKVCLSDMAGKIATQLQEEQADRNVKFNIQQDLYANVDQRLLEVALSNLLGNAFKFTGKTQKAVIEFGQTEIDGQKTFLVRDNGVGFDMSLAKKLFGAFQRMHRASEFPGTGVGLTTVQRIVHRHGGRIWAEAAINQGATFYFTLEELL